MPKPRDDNAPMLDPSRVGNGPLIATVCGILIVLCGFTLWQARPLYHWFQGLRAIQQIPEARQLADNGQFEEALQLMNTIYHLAPENHRVLRAAGEISVAAKSAESREFYRKLVELGKATFEDRRELARIYINTREIERADTLCRELLAERPDDPTLLFLAADLHRIHKKHRQAMESLNKGLKNDPDNHLRRLLLAGLLIEHGITDEERRLGWSYVLQTAQTPDETGLAAIELLVGAEKLPAAVDEAVGEIILAHPLADDRLQLEVSRRRARPRPERREEIIAAAIAARSAFEPHELEPLYHWLSSEEEYGRILDTLTLETARLNQGLFVIYLNALGQHRKEWARIQELLDDPSIPLSPPIRAFCLAFTAQQSGKDETTVETHMQQALNSAQRHGNIGGAFGIGSYAESLGLYKQAEVAYALAERSPEFARRALESQVRLAKIRGNSLAVWHALRRFHFRYPNRSDLTEECLYLNALIGIEIESTLDKALKMVEEEPARVFPRIIAGLAFYRMNNIPGLNETCGDSLDLGEMNPGEMIAYTAILSAIGRPERAREVARDLARNVNTEKLLEEERRILAPWLPPAGG